MTADDKTSGPAPSKRSAQIRLIGNLVLALGIGGAGVVYWQGTRSPDPADDISMLGYDKAGQRQMGVLYGKMGSVIDGLLDDLKRPGNQAALIVVVTGLIAAGCFYFAPWLDNDDKTD